MWQEFADGVGGGDSGYRRSRKKMQVRLSWMVCPREVSMNQQDLHTYCLRWIAWRESRRLYVKPMSGNVLARLQPSRIGTEPDAALDPQMPCFEMAVAAMREMPEHEASAVCFWLFYVERVRRIKVVASRLGIGRRTFYDRVHRAARLAHKLSVGIAKAQQTVLAQGSPALVCED